MPTLVEIGPSNASQGQHRRKEALEGPISTRVGIILTTTLIQSRHIINKNCFTIYIYIYISAILLYMYAYIYIYIYICIYMHSLIKNKLCLGQQMLLLQS